MAAKDFFDAVIAAEGTAKKRNPYDEVLGYGRYAEPPKPLSQMTVREVERWSNKTLRPAAKRIDGLNSSASGAFQITSQNLRDLIKRGILDPDELYDAQVQQRAAAVIAQEQGIGAWEGFKYNASAKKIAQQNIGFVKGGPVPSAEVGFGARTLKAGREGADVAELQRALATAGFDPGKIDGVFGGDTKAALKAFQKANGLPADGVMTRAASKDAQAVRALAPIVAQNRAADAALVDMSPTARDERQAAQPMAGLAGSEFSASPLSDALGVGAPVTSVTRAPLSPITPAQRVPDTAARQVPDTVAPRVPDNPLRPIGPTYAPDRPVTNKDLIDTVGQNLKGNTYRVQPPAPQKTPEQIATESLRKQLTNMQAMPRINPASIGVDPRNLPINAGSGGGVYAPDFNRTVGPSNAPVASASSLRRPQIAQGVTGRGAGSIAPYSAPNASAAASAIQRSYPVGNSAVGAGGPPNNVMRFSSDSGPSRPALQSALNSAAAQKRTSIQNAIGNEMAGAYAPQKSPVAAAATARPAPMSTYTPELARMNAQQQAFATRDEQPFLTVTNPVTQNPVAAPGVPVPRPSPVPSPLTGAPGLIPEQTGWMNSPLGGALVGGLTGGPLGALLGTAKGAGVFNALGAYLKGQGGGIPNSNSIVPGSAKQIPGGALGTTQVQLTDGKGRTVNVNVSNKTGVTSLATGKAGNTLKAKTRASRISKGLVV